MSNYYFVHQQKTGGTSLINEVEYSGLYKIWGPHQILADFDSIDPNADNFFHGHTHASLKNLFDFYVIPIVFLREPSKRVISLWNHTQYEANEQWGFGEWGFREAFWHIVDADADTILADPVFTFMSNNAITRKLAQQFDYTELKNVASVNREEYIQKYKTDLMDYYVPTSEDLEKAKAFLDTAIIGITEEYEESMNRIGSLMGFTPEGFHLRPSDDTVTNVLIGRETEINAANNLDYELWEYNKTLFASQTP